MKPRTAVTPLTMSERHLTSVDDLPPVRDGTLRLYSMLYCPFAQRPRLVLHHKGIEFETVNVNLQEKASLLFKMNPNGLVPIMEQDKKVLYESGVIMDYLDEAFPGPTLTPTHPYIKAKGRIIGEEFSKILPLYYKLLRSSEEERPAAVHAVHEQVDKFESYLPNTKFFCGNQVSMVDYFCWPWAERFPIHKCFFQVDIITQERCPKLHAWVSAMEATPGVKATRIDTDQHYKFNVSYVAGKPDYDFMLKK